MCVDQLCLKSAVAGSTHSASTFLMLPIITIFVAHQCQTNCTIGCVCRPIVSAQLSCGRGAGHTHTVAVASNCAIKYSVLSSVVQCAPVFTSLLLSVCRQTNCVSWAVGGVPPCRPHTHSGSTLSTANQPALSVKQTVFWPKIVKTVTSFGHNLVTVWQLSISVKHSFVTKN